MPKYAHYVEPPRADTAVPIDQPLPGGIRFSLNESDSGSIISLKNGDIVEITLSTIPGLAFRGIMPAEGSGLTLLNAGPFYEMPEKNGDYYSGFIGRGYYRWRYRADVPGTEIIDGIFSISGLPLRSIERVRYIGSARNGLPGTGPWADRSFSRVSDGGSSWVLDLQSVRKEHDLDAAIRWSSPGGQRR